MMNLVSYSEFKTQFRDWVTSDFHYFFKPPQKNMRQLQNGRQLLMPTRAHTSFCSRPVTITNVHKRSPLAPVLSQIQLWVRHPQEHTIISCFQPDTTSPHLIYIISQPDTTSPHLIYIISQPDTTSPHLIYIISFHFITDIGNTRL
jgi:hypothetical protein